MYENFDKVLKEKGITAYKVAKHTDISTVTFTNWKKGKSIPKNDKMQKIADFLGVSVDYLYGNTKNKHENFVYTVSPEEASSVILKKIAGEENFNHLSLQEKRQFEKQLYELAELAYLKIKSNKTLDNG